MPDCCRIVAACRKEVFSSSSVVPLVASSIGVDSDILAQAQRQKWDDTDTVRSTRTPRSYRMRTQVIERSDTGYSTHQEEGLFLAAEMRSPY